MMQIPWLSIVPAAVLTCRIVTNTSPYLGSCDAKSTGSEQDESFTGTSGEYVRIRGYPSDDQGEFLW